LDLSIKMMEFQCTSGDDVLLLARVLLANAALQMKRMLGGLAPGDADQMLCYLQNEWAGKLL
jgi:hypothetical protein